MSLGFNSATLIHLHARQTLSLPKKRMRWRNRLIADRSLNDGRCEAALSPEVCSEKYHRYNLFLVNVFHDRIPVTSKNCLNILNVFGGSIRSIYIQSTCAITTHEKYARRIARQQCKKIVFPSPLSARRRRSRGFGLRSI